MRSASVRQYNKGRLWPVVCALLVLLAIPGRASATVLTYVPSAGVAGVGNDLGDLDHHYYYAWTIGLISIPAGQSISSAYVTFTNLYNWDTNKNVLYMDLLSGPASGGNLISSNTGTNSAGDTYNSTVRYASDPDVPAGSSTVTNFADAFDGANALNNSAKTDLSAHSFLPDNMNPTNPADIAWLQNVLTTNTAPATNPGTLPASYATIAGTQWSVVQNGTGMYDYTYTFTAGQLAALSSYIGPSSDPDRDITLAFDPDCHFFNDGVSFTLVTGSVSGGAAVPEPASLMLLGTGLLLSAQQYRRRRAKKALK